MVNLDLTAMSSFLPISLAALDMCSKSIPWKAVEQTVNLSKSVMHQ